MLTLLETLPLEALIKIAIAIAGLMTGAAYLVLVERWMAAWIQGRIGPNRVGIPLTKIRLFGLGQPIADGVKFIFKEEYVPAHVDKWLYYLAPIAVLTAALAAFAVIPFGSVLPPIDALDGVQQPIQLVVAPGVDVGMLYVFALSSMAIYGVTLGGWASNNKYSFLGGLRSSAQMIAYEIPLGLGILGVVLMTSSLRLDEIISTQAESGVWFAFTQPLGLLVFSVAACAEAGRLPFDLPEAEQELVGGYHTEYAGMKLMMYLVGEFLHMITAAFLIVILFFGGWHFWGITGSDNVVTWFEAIARVVVLMAKILGVVLMFMLIRWSWPRFRFDQLMALAWKVMLPLGLVHLVTMAVMSEYAERWGGSNVALLSIAVGWTVAISACLAAGMFASISSEDQAVRE